MLLRTVSENNCGAGACMMNDRSGLWAKKKKKKTVSVLPVNVIQHAAHYSY